MRNIKIESKITGYSVNKVEESVAPVTTPVEQPVMNIDPFSVRIDHRPSGELDAKIEKIEYSTQEGVKKAYIAVSFLPVDGVFDNIEFKVDRPIEFFFPGQITQEHQWITATMRNLSLAARGGYLVQALQDLIKVKWDKGPVRCGKNEYGKPMYHDSEVAAIAWSIQQILYRKGLLDVAGNQIPARIFAERTQEVPNLEVVDSGISESEKPSEAKAATAKASNKQVVGECPECTGDLVLMDGCPTCVEGCGFSKCG